MLRSVLFSRLTYVAFAVAIAGLGVSRVARVAATQARPAEVVNTPYSLSKQSAPILALGYRELVADLMFVRLMVYFGSAENRGPAIATMAETITALDPQFARVYDFAAIAITSAAGGVDNPTRLRAIALLAEASRRFPMNWKYPMLAGQIYLVDLQTQDPAQRRDWDEKGAVLLETASRKPNAPASSALVAASLLTRFGQQQRAIDSLRELLLITSDDAARRNIIDQIAKLATENADEIGAELIGMRNAFEREWKRDRPTLPLTFFILLGPPPQPGFNLGELATGGRDVIGTETFERLEPLTDEPPPSGPGSP